MTYCAVLLLCFQLTIIGVECAQLTLPTFKWGSGVFRGHWAMAPLGNKIFLVIFSVRQCGLVESAPTWNGTGCEFDSWQCRIYIPCSLSLRLLGSLQGSLGTYGLTQKLCLKKWEKIGNKHGLAPFCVSTSGQRKFGPPL